MWSARVNKTGTKIQLLKDGSVSKVIEASEDTFAPFEAQKFAEETIENLNKTAKQMTDPGAQPAVDTKGEQQQKSLDAAKAQATGKAVKDASSKQISKEAFDKIENENKNLKQRIAKVEKEASIERKARRGLTIAKALVEQEKLANDENTIKNKVMQITAMSNDEIGLLERKVANEPLYDSIEEASKAGRRYARMARLHRQAAEDAQAGGDDAIADVEDVKAATYEDLSKEAYNEAEKYGEAGYNNTADKGTADDAAQQVDKPAQGVDAKGKKAADEMKPEIDDIMFQAEEEDDDDILEDDVVEEDVVEELDEETEAELEDEEDYMNMEAASKIYRKIASNHRAKAEDLKKEGKEKEANTELEIASESDQLAENVEKQAKEAKEAAEKKAAEDKVANKDETTIKSAAEIYRKIAADHKKKADELELAGNTKEADVEDGLATEATKLAENLESFITKESEEEIVDEEIIDEDTVDEVTEEDKEAMVKSSEDDETVDEETVDEEDIEALEDETLEDDAIIENTAMENVINENEDVDEMPSDNEIAAALANDVDEDVDEEVVEEEIIEASNDEEKTVEETEDKEADSQAETKTATDKGETRKVSEITKSANINKVEENPMSGQVDGLEDLWKN